MKKHLFFCLSLLLLLVACGKSDDEQPIVTPNTPEVPETPENPSNPDVNPDEPENPSTPDDEVVEHEYVDLGLPSGTLWATKNIGATLPADNGDYFAWGETSPKENYDWSTYKWCNGTHQTLTKYNLYAQFGTVDDKISLEAEDDAAVANWGSAWCMPTGDMMEELWNPNYCTWTWTTATNSKGESVDGYEVKSKSNGNSIFLPAAGVRNGTGLYYTLNGEFGVSSGYYWSSSLYKLSPNNALDLLFQDGDYNKTYYTRRDGCSVRPVRASAQE